MSSDGDALPTGKKPGVISLNVLASNLTMRGWSDWEKQRLSWPEVPPLRLYCARLFHGQPFTSDTIECLIAWFQVEGGLSPDQARHLPLEEAVRRLKKALEEPKKAEGTATPPNQGGNLAPPAKKSKRSTQRCESRTKIIAALTLHHQYADGGCLNQEPIGNNELATLVGVSGSTASAFFTDKFKGYAKYRAVCRDPGVLADSLKALNDEFSPHDLYGRRPPNEDARDDE